MKRILNALALFLLVLVPSLALAAPDEDAARLFNDGRRLFDEGKYDEALAKFEKTLALHDSPNARLYMARALHELDRSVEAYDEMVHAKEDAEARNEPKYVHTRDIAAARLAIIEKEIGRVIVVLSEADDSIQLTVGERKIPNDRIGKMIPVKPGTVQVVATTSSGEEVRKETLVAAGTLVTVSLDVSSNYTDEPTGAPPVAPTATPAPDPGPDQPAEPEEESDPSTSLIATGIVVATVGVAGMDVFGV
ncbi:MAG: hypothetical protein JRI23_03640, partial [Deltaproteobacteria bacterium]|nr:hypothetical protein [Deltaproteobacteria bacterium]MBW2530609.1 hypothetical protein [Deltaproteobacteria bacterium]